MSDNERTSQQSAASILRGAPGWIDWDAAHNRPNWVGGRITLDGRFSVDELLALLRRSNAPH
ncbi:hypothetical protein [Burkholderia glumae]|uniref:hypothetical protein n=1 Tax=Burkholderia glumae TaxID=337 RepID=UPI0002D82675|nr:hypothetical protein [Burkholderia glumae]PJO22876.1 hypothetical protein Y5A_012175 [Burkholderia glumae AU6208]QHE13537.1 hypothetical protein GQR88_25285 [Burkholderia glumae AU6208]